MIPDVADIRKYFLLPRECNCDQVQCKYTKCKYHPKHKEAVK